MVTIKARQCDFDPRVWAGQPIGMAHCPSCGDMVVAAMKHGPCLAGICPAVDEGTHTGPEIEVELDDEIAQVLGLSADG